MLKPNTVYDLNWLLRISTLCKPCKGLYSSFVFAFMFQADFEQWIFAYILSNIIAGCSVKFWIITYFECKHDFNVVCKFQIQPQFQP